MASFLDLTLDCYGEVQIQDISIAYQRARYVGLAAFGAQDGAIRVGQILSELRPRHDPRAA
jgi:hypothetical protein